MLSRYDRLLKDNKLLNDKLEYACRLQNTSRKLSAISSLVFVIANITSLIVFSLIFTKKVTESRQMLPLLCLTNVVSLGVFALHLFLLMCCVYAKAKPLQESINIHTHDDTDQQYSDRSQLLMNSSSETGSHSSYPNTQINEIGDMEQEHVPLLHFSANGIPSARYINAAHCVNT